MISLMYTSQSRLATVTIVFYTCVLLPLMELKKALLSILSFVFLARCHHRVDEDDYKVGPAEWSWRQPEVLVAYHRVSNKDGGVSPEEETCSICLVEFEKENRDDDGGGGDGEEEILRRVDRCRHLFHKECIDKWLDCNHFTCPLCRSFLLVKS